VITGAGAVAGTGATMGAGAGAGPLTRRSTVVGGLNPGMIEVAGELVVIAFLTADDRSNVGGGTSDAVL
jgi:hypothetical protein